MTVRCTVVLPAHNRSFLTQQCMDAILSTQPRVAHELVVVDDGSTDGTATSLGRFDGRVRVLRHDAPAGFAEACNAGAAVAAGDFVVFLNNDTLPCEGWLDGLVSYADTHREAAVVGAKLLFPNGTIQHAGAALCHDGYPRHLYVGFPPDHPAVDRSRAVRIVTGACMLVRRREFAAVGGFDPIFRNGFEDADLCLRLAERGHEVHYCHESVLYHLESATRDPAGADARAAARAFRERWAGRARSDDVERYLEDGLLRLGYEGPRLRVAVSPLLGATQDELQPSETASLLQSRSLQVLDLLREITRLTLAVGQLADAPPRPRQLRQRAPRGGSTSHQDTTSPLPRLVQRADEIEEEILELQCEVAASTATFEASRALVYRRLVRDVRRAADDLVPDGATVLIVSRGDEELLKLHRRVAWHFPREEHGLYAGHHPVDAAAAVEQLEELRAQGADFLLVPDPSRWWFEHYEDFARHLERYPAHERPGVCTVFDLTSAA